MTGKPKWHKVAEGDLPEEGTEVLNDDGEELFKKNFPEYVTEKGVCLSPYWDIFCAGLEAGETKQHNLPDFETEATEYALEWGDKTDGTYACCRDGYLAGAESGYEQGIGRLRYCCTCKKWEECRVVSMYGICADWEIKGE